MAQPATLTNTGTGEGSQPAASYPVRLSRQILRRHMVATRKFIDDLLLTRKLPRDGVEFAPPFEGEAIDKFLM